MDELFNLLQFIEPDKFYDKLFFMNQFTNLEREGQVRERTFSKTPQPPELV